MKEIKLNKQKESELLDKMSALLNEEDEHNSLESEKESEIDSAFLKKLHGEGSAQKLQAPPPALPNKKMNVRIFQIVASLAAVVVAGLFASPLFMKNDSPMGQESGFQTKSTTHGENSEFCEFSLKTKQLQETQVGLVFGKCGSPGYVHLKIISPGEKTAHQHRNVAIQAASEVLLLRGEGGEPLVVRLPETKGPFEISWLFSGNRLAPTGVGHSDLASDPAFEGSDIHKGTVTLTPEANR